MSDNGDIAARLERIEGKIDGLETKVDANHTDVTSRIGGLESRIDGLQAEVESNHAGVKALMAEVNESVLESAKLAGRAASLIAEHLRDHKQGEA